MSDTKTKRKTGKRAVIALIVILFILVLLALPWIYLQFAAFPYDDYRTMAAENGEPFDFVDFTPEGELTVRLTKADLYSLLLEYAPPEELLKQAALTGVVRLEVEELGFTLTPEEARLSLRLEALGSLHLPVQLRARVEEAGDGLLLTPETVYIGPLLHTSAEKLARRLGQPDLAQPYLLSPTDYGAEGVVLRAGKNEVLLSLKTPSMFSDLMDLNVSRYTTLLDFYGVEERPAASAAAWGEGFAAAFRAAIREGTARDLLTSYLAVGEEGVSELLEEVTADFPSAFVPDWEEVGAQRRAAMALLSEGQRKYETLLETLRSKYAAGELTLVPGGFRAEDRPLRLSDLGWTDGEPEAWRIVYLYNYSATHQAATADMPAADSLTYTDISALPEGGVRYADLGLLMPFPQGQYILMYRTAPGELVLNALPEDCVRELLASELTPTLRTDDIPGPPRWTLAGATAEDLMPVYYLFPEE